MKRNLGAVFLLLSLCFLFFSRLFFPVLSFFFTPDLGRSDIFHHYYSSRFTLSQTLKNGYLPFWTENLGTGFPIFAIGHIAPFNLINFLLFFFLPTPIAFNLSYPIFIFLSCLGMFFLGRFFKFSVFTAVFTAFVFSFSGFFIFRFTQSIYLGATYLPFIFLFTFKLIRENKISHLLILSFLLSQQIFAGHPQIVFITLIGISLIVFFWHFKVKNLFWVGSAVIFAFLLSAVQLIPLLEFKKESIRDRGLTYQEVTANSISPKELATLIYPFVFGNPKIASYQLFKSDGFDIFWEKNSYLGIIPLIFALIGIFLAKSQTSVRKTFLVLLLVSLILAFGRISPLFFLYDLPPFNLFRVPARFLLLFLFALSVFGGFGSEYIFKKIQGKLTIIDLFFIKFFLILSVFIPAFLIVYNYHPLVPTTKVLEEPESSLFFKKKPGRIYQAGAGYPYLLNLFNSGWQDISYFLFARNSLAANSNLVYQQPQVLVYDSALTKRGEVIQSLLQNEIVADLTSFTATPTALFKNLLSTTSTRYLISPFKITDSDLPLIKTIKSPDKTWPPFYIYENQQVLPRARFVGQIIKIDSFEETLNRIKKENINFANTALLEQFPKEEFISQNNQGEIKILKTSDLQIKLMVNTKKETVLLLADSFYPGWKAYVDGKETKIFPANINQRAIIIPEGRHQVEFLYQSSSFKKGLLISSFALLIWLILTIRQVVKKYEN